MSEIKICTGNIFTSKCQTIVNTVNCAGVMGAGIALEFRFRYPDMYEKYKQLCQNEMIIIGSLWIYKTQDKWILNFPTKKNWKYPSKFEYLEQGLQKFLETYESKGIESIAFPLLGASKGGLDPNKSQEVMEMYLSKCNIPVEIYHYDPLAYDDLYIKFKDVFESMSTDEIKMTTNLRIDFIEKLRKSLNNQNIRSLSRLSSVKGIGFKTLEKAFKLVMKKTKQKTFNFD